MRTPEGVRAPYPGLRPFEADEADLFFGREHHVDALLKRLSGSHFVAVVGESGAGKSSLVRAGLLPALQAGFVVEAGSDWRVAVMRPGGAPLAALAEALLEPGVLSDAGGSPRQEFALAELRRGPLGLVQLVADAHLGHHCNLLVVVDQFEEVFRYCREPAQKDQADMFVELLLRAADQRHVPIFIVLTMRSDFVGDCARFRGLPETLNDNQYLTPRLTREQIAAAISEPARVCGGVVEPALVDELCNAVGDNPDQLPLLQHLLMRIWDRASERSTPPRLTGDLSVMMGGLYSALNHHAQNVYDSLREDQKPTARAMFKRLTDPLSQRRDLRRDALVGDVAGVAGADVAAVIAVADAFRAHGRHMLMPPPAIPLDADSRLDISHESLIRQWITLNEWAREEQACAREYHRLRDEAQAELEGQADLLTGRELARALDWMKLAEPTPAWAARYGEPGQLETTLDFINRGAAAAQRQKDEQKRLVAREAAAKRAWLYSFASAGALVLATVIAAIIFNLWRQAEAKRVDADTQRAAAVTEKATAQKEREEASRQRQVAEAARGKAILNEIEARRQQELAVGESREAAEARGQAHARQLAADSRIQVQNDPALAVVLAGAAVEELRSAELKNPELKRDDQAQDAMRGALDALRGALAWHVPNIESTFPVAKSRHFVPGSHKGSWLDFSLDDASVSSRDPVAVVPSGNTAIIWSLASAEPRPPLQAHTGIVGAARFSPDGTLVATSSQDHTARLWDAATGKPLAVLEGHTRMLNDVVFSPDGKLVITLGDDARAKMWAIGDDYSKPACELMAPTPQGNFVTASFSHDRQLLATVVHTDPTWSAQVWNVAGGACPNTPERSFAPAFGVKWTTLSPYGPWLGIVRVDGEVIVLNTTDWSEKRKIAAVGKPASADEEEIAKLDEAGRRLNFSPPLAWSADGRYFAAAGTDHILRVMTIDGDSAPTELRGHTGRVTSLRFHPSVNVLLSTSVDGTARLWKLGADRRPLEVLVLRGHKDRVGSAVFASGGNTIVTAGDDGRVRVWQPRWTLMEKQLAGATSAAFAPDGRSILVTGTSGGGRPSGWLGAFDRATLAASTPPSPLSSQFVRFVGSYLIDRPNLRTLSVRDVRHPDSVTTLTRSEQLFQINERVASPDGRFLIGKTGESVMWDLSAPASPPEKVTAPGDCEVKAISTGKRIAWYCAEDDRLMMTRSGDPALTIQIADRAIATVMQFSTGGRFLAVNFQDRSVRVFDTTSGRTAITLRGHDDPIVRLIFSANDRLLLGIGLLRSRIWSLPAGERIALLPSSIYGSSIDTPDFSRDSRSLIFVVPGRLLVWQCDACGSADALLAEAGRRKIDRTLSSDEVLRFGLGREGAPAGHDHADSHVARPVPSNPIATSTSGTKPR